MPKPLPIYLHTFRKRMGLSQRELSQLLHISPETLSKIERLGRVPTASVVIATGLIFDAAARDLFPAFYEKVEEALMRQAAALYEELGRRKGDRAKEKQKLLLEMVGRIPPSDLDV